MNLRDDEFRAVQDELGEEIQGITDVWVWCGSDKSEKYTWDTFANTNCKGRFKYRARFDRLFCLAPGVTNTTRAELDLANGTTVRAWQPIDFQLVGKDEVLDIDRFPSDHWAMLATFMGPGSKLEHQSQSTASQLPTQINHTAVKDTEVAKVQEQAATKRCKGRGGSACDKHLSDCSRDGSEMLNRSSVGDVDILALMLMCIVLVCGVTLTMPHFRCGPVCSDEQFVSSIRQGFEIDCWRCCRQQV
eukprot:gnl/TRDRNA2_/TRDRNA2_168481_c2_seq1.p1 gnl/TRDRNA2_/TRDRNA2_168481_c2~~gnl/TRDRNA2_/TRDRNA2_168481_c2_seq1.p1  ORF type:complete len:246 (-),score=35.28 gnl/TRDRNA2_/TRDRNA2_168481_c2_seq1:17-754(-)